MAIGKPFAKDIESACGASLHEQTDSGHECPVKNRIISIGYQM
jgi:hypothetical protein